MTPIFTGQYKSGIIDLDHSTGEVLTVVCSERFTGYLRGLEGKDVELTIQRLRKIRSDNQHGLHRIWCRVIADEMQESPEEIHRLAKKRAGFVTCKQIGDKKEEFIKSQKDMTTIEMMAVMRELEWIAQFLGIRLPQPEELAEMRGKK